ncbi:hypothetical protein ACWM35_21210 [Neobacillus sp. K501]
MLSMKMEFMDNTEKAQHFLSMKMEFMDKTEKDSALVVHENMFHGQIQHLISQRMEERRNAHSNQSKLKKTAQSSNVSSGPFH